jgi:hypothetical protein
MASLVLLRESLLRRGGSGIKRLVHNSTHWYVGGPWVTVPELLFEKKHLIPAVQ